MNRIADGRFNTFNNFITTLHIRFRVAEHHKHVFAIGNELKRIERKETTIQYHNLLLLVFSLQ